MKQFLIAILVLAFSSCGVHHMAAYQPITPSKVLADTIQTRPGFFTTYHYSNGVLLSDIGLQIKTSQMPEANRLIHQSQRNFGASLIFDAISLTVIPLMFDEYSASAVPAALIFGVSEVLSVYLWVKSVDQERKAIKMHNDYLRNNAAPQHD